MSETKYDCKEIMGKVTELRKLQMEFDGAIPEKATGEYSAVNGISARLESLLVLLENEIPKTDEEIESEKALEVEKKLEKTLAKIKPFMKEAWKQWFIPQLAETPQRPSLIDPKSLDLDSLKNDVDETKFGEYTLNPECLDIDFDKTSIKVLDIRQEIQDNNLQDLAQIGRYVIDRYSKDYIIPDLSFWQWIIQKGIDSPIDLQDGMWYYCFGSILRNSGGGTRVPVALWGASHFSCLVSPLSDGWDGSCRVVLLKR